MEIFILFTTNTLKNIRKLSVFFIWRTQKAVYHYAIAYVTANGDTDVYGDTSKDITLAVGQNAVEITNIPVSVDPRE